MRFLPPGDSGSRYDLVLFSMVLFQNLPSCVTNKSDFCCPRFFRGNNVYTSNTSLFSFVCWSEQTLIGRIRLYKRQNVTVHRSQTEAGKVFTILYMNLSACLCCVYLVVCLSVFNVDINIWPHFSPKSCIMLMFTGFYI